MPTKPPMPTATLRALKESIAHWKRMRKDAKTCKANGEVPYGRSCSLCTRFLNFGECQRNGEQCPVYSKSGATCCRQTPWMIAAAAFDNYMTGDYSKQTWQAAADREIKFLESLLPKEKAKTSR